MTIGNRSCLPMSLKAFDLGEVEQDRVDANGRPVFRHRRGWRALWARLSERWAGATTPLENTRPSDRA